MTPSSFRFYFSFRSPYAWIAAERLAIELGEHARRAALIPIYPTQQTFPNDPTRVPNKLRYIAKDVARLAREYDLPLKNPPAIDTDWAAAHAAFCGAQALRKGYAFMLEMFRSRWSEGLDIGRSEVIAAAATRCDLDPERILVAAADGANRAYVANTFSRGQDEDGIFGVPSFVFNGSLYWGHDRMGMLRRAIDRAAATSEAPLTAG
jgi:2-hydroxychromene-2-carboxylate isomerase